MTLYAIFNGSCPDGWTQYTADDGRYIYVTNTSLEGTGGATTKTHSHTRTTGTFKRCHSAVSKNCPDDTWNITNTWNENIEPKGIKQVLCKAPINGFPSDSILISDSATCPNGWSEYATGDSQYILFTETEGDAGSAVSGNMGNHRHVQGAAAREGSDAGGSNPGSYTGYSTLITAYTDLYHVKFMLCKKD